MHIQHKRYLLVGCIAALSIVGLTVFRAVLAQDSTTDGTYTTTDGTTYYPTTYDTTQTDTTATTDGTYYPTTYTTTNTTDTTSGTAVSTIVVSVYPSVASTYCEGTASYGKVIFNESPSVGLSYYVVDGSGSGVTVAAGTYVRLLSGSYTWRAVINRTDVSLTTTSGGFSIPYVCQTTTTDTTSTTNTTDTTTATTATVPVPPANFEVLREGEVTFVLADAGSSVPDLYAYGIYRRCADMTWWLIGKARISECGGVACTYSVTDRPTGDTCEYAVSSINTAGLESEKSVAKRPTVSDTTSDDTTTSTETPITTAEVERQIASGKYVIYLRTANATSVEWNMYPDGSRTAVYLGQATYNRDKDYWEYVWDTTKVPNGDYTLSPSIHSLVDQTYENVPILVRVENAAVPVASTDPTIVDIVKEAAQDVQEVVDASGGVEQVAKEDIVDVLEPYAQKVADHIEEKGDEGMKQELAAEQERVETELRTLLNMESSKLLSAMNGDEEEFRRFENKVILAAQVSTESIFKVADEFGIELSDEEKEELEKEVMARLAELEGVIRERREVLQERVGDKVFEDTDKDGISNYDEVNIYKTDPTLSDTDNDGFFDGAEILGGFDPLDPAAEAIVEYEEPRTGGFLEEETFTVENIAVSETKIDETGREDAAKFVLAGKAPANSFITLYVYSTPIIVTVKTDEYGGWTYELDKELEDGDHEVYVAITDNTGKIYAKSKPLPFVKEASAVTIDENALYTGGDARPSLFRNAYFYAAVLLVIMIIGWALVITGSRHAAVESQSS